jgi:hypothetical protein
MQIEELAVEEALRRHLTMAGTQNLRTGVQLSGQSGEPLHLIRFCVSDLAPTIHTWHGCLGVWTTPLFLPPTHLVKHNDVGKLKLVHQQLGQRASVFRRHRALRLLPTVHTSSGPGIQRAPLQSQELRRHSHLAPKGSTYGSPSNTAIPRSASTTVTHRSM